MQADFIVSQPGFIHLLAAVSIYLILWVILKAFSRVHPVLRSISTLILLLGSIGTCEILKVFPDISGHAPFVRLINGMEIVLAAVLTIHLVIVWYIGTYLEHRNIVVNRIIRDIVRLVIILGFILIFLRYVLHLNLATILTPSAILTAIIGLSMQDTIGNLISGIILQIEKPFELDDWIEVDGQRGKVREINWRYTKIETLESLYIVIPNNKLSSDKVINYSKPTRSIRQYLDIGISYSVPPFKVKKAILPILKSNPSIIEPDTADVSLHEYGDSSINYKIVYTIGDFTIHRKVRDEVFSAIWYQFQKWGIEIPFPTRSLIMHQEKIEPDIKGITDLLSRLPLFQGVRDEHLKMLARFGIVHHVETETLVVQDGEAGDSMFFILDGEYDVIKNETMLTRLRRGDCFGEMCILADENRSATVKAAASGQLFEIGRWAFKALIETEPIMIRHIESLFEERVKSLTSSRDKKIDQDDMKVTLFSRFKNLFGLS